MYDYHIPVYIEFNSHVHELNTFSGDLLVIQRINLYTFVFLKARVSRIQLIVGSDTRCCYLTRDAVFPIISYITLKMNNHAIILTLLFFLLLKANDHIQYFRIGKKPSELSLVAVSSSQSLILRLQYSANAVSQIRLASSANVRLKKV